MRLAFTALTIFAAAATASYALAINKADTNGDGMLSLAEVQAVMPKVTKAEFNKADTNSDGKLSAKELAAAQKDGVLPMKNQG